MAGEQKQVNTFHAGMNLDIADIIMPDKLARFAQNVRFVNLAGSNFIVSNIKGNQVRFQLTTGFKPVAAQEFNGVLYIVSWNDNPVSENYKKLELGTYPSPDYADINGNIYVYRPLHNLDEADFRTLAFDINEKPIIQKLEIQPDYDESCNMVFTIVGKTPRIVNTRFKVNKLAAALELNVIAPRAAAANSNSYQNGTVAKESSLILSSDKMLKIAFNTITSGGKLKLGNYTYVFQYMTEDFNKTGIVGQSMLCQVAFGNSLNSLQGGDESQESNKRVILNLTNVDTDFAFLKVFALYSSGQEALAQQTLELTQPIPITGSTMQFTHTGYEELAEVSADTVNLDYAVIESANASTQIGGYYMLGGVVQRSYNYQPFKDAAASVVPSFKVADLPTGTLPDYADPANVYNYLGYMGFESYPFGMVFVMPGNQLSPVFPIQGKYFTGADADEPALTGNNQANGIITFPSSNQFRCHKTGRVRVKYLQFDFSAGPMLAIKNQCLGFFIVRGERRPWAITQGIMIPTLRVPPIEYTKYEAGEVYEHVYLDGTDSSRYKNVPLMDNLIEAHELDGNQSSDDSRVMTVDLQEDPAVGRMPIYINDLKAINPARLDNIPQNQWAFISGEALLNEPAYVTALQRSNSYVQQVAKINFTVQENMKTMFLGNPWNGSGGILTGIHYLMTSLNNTGYTAPGTANFKLAKLIDYVIAETFATGSKFISKMIHRYFTFGTVHRYAYGVYQAFNSYFGIEMTDALIDSTRSATNPISGNARIAGGLYNSSDQPLTSGTRYNNLNTTVPGGFLANVYPDTNIPAQLVGGSYVNSLYPSIDTVSYKQCSKWYSWSDIPLSGPMTNKVDVYGGDCFISRVSRRLYQSGFRDSGTSGNSTWPRANMPSGILITWYQESKYNLWLRQEKLFDASETMKRSFFPLKSNGDAVDYQQYRYPETLESSPGYTEVMPPKTFFAPPSLAPFIQNQFFSRIYHSEKHIPNAFKNGYRNILPTNFKDYDSSMGVITGLFNHRGKLVIIFQHGMGITDIEQRVPIGGDAAGEVFIKPTDVLPPTIQYLSREIGCQDNLSLVQTPGAIYGVDRSKDKIWMISDKLEVISDNSIASFITGNIVNPRSGYDLQFNEVLFTTDNWTICWKEGMNVWVSFYSFKPDFYARRTKDMYSFLTSTAWLHNTMNFSIYGEDKDAIVEFVFNPNIQLTKVLDYLNLIGNEVAPIKVEVYTYNQEVELGETIDVPSCNQYVRIDNVYDAVREASPIIYRDKKFVVAIPSRTDYSPGSAEDRWSIGGRLRDKHIIVRLTYNTQSPLELASVISNYRYSVS